MSNALVIVDMQKYYLQPDSDFHLYHESERPGCMKYISERTRNITIPNIQRLLDFFRSNSLPVLYLKLCGTKEDRSDLHRFFSTAHHRARHAGYKNLYPLHDNEYSNIIEPIGPQEGEKVFAKTTFSPFCTSGIADALAGLKITALTFTGLATSQCVETSARDASDRGFSVIHIEDAEADYTEESHYASLYSSQPVCGGWVYDTDHFLSHYDKILHSIEVSEELTV